MRKNVAGQTVSAVMVSATDGSAITASVAISVTGDHGTQGAGGGTLAHEGGGEWSYIPTQAETNFDHIMFKFDGGGSVPQGVQVYTMIFGTGEAANAPSVNIKYVKDEEIQGTGALGNEWGPAP